MHKNSSLSLGNPGISKSLIEKHELLALDLIEQALKIKFQEYLLDHGQIRFHDLLLTLSRQGKGRATTAYNFTIEEILRSYLSNNLDANKDRELRCRIAACPLFKVALERFVAHSVISWLVSNNIPYKNCHLPTSADFAILIEDEVLPNVYEHFGESLPEMNEYNSILLSVDAKSIMALSNLGDALTHNSILGKFEANWNQLSYIPPKLGAAMASNDRYFNLKYHPIKPVIFLNGIRYLLISIFVSDLAVLPDMSFFDDPLESLNGSYFNDYCTITTIPNGLLKSDFYDSFFSAGKGGCSDEGVRGFPNYPRDCRFQIINSQGQVAIFENLLGTRFRFRYLNQEGRYKAITLDSSTGELKEEKFYVRRFTGIQMSF